jgi:hypothetical protein
MQLLTHLALFEKWAASIIVFGLPILYRCWTVQYMKGTVPRNVTRPFPFHLGLVSLVIP